MEQLHGYDFKSVYFFIIPRCLLIEVTGFICGEFILNIHLLCNVCHVSFSVFAMAEPTYGLLE